MVGTAREAEFLLRVALLASQFRPWVQDCGMPASQRGILHHQTKTVVSERGNGFFFYGSVFHTKTPTLYRLWHHAVELCLMSQSTPLPIAQ